MPIAQIINLEIPWHKVDTQLAESPATVIWFVPVTELNTIRDVFVYELNGTETYCTYIYAVDENGDDVGDIIVAVRVLKHKLGGTFKNVVDLISYQMTVDYEINEAHTVEVYPKAAQVAADEEVYDQDLAGEQLVYNDEDYEEEFFDLAKYKYYIGTALAIVVLGIVIYLAFW